MLDEYLVQILHTSLSTIFLPPSIVVLQLIQDMVLRSLSKSCCHFQKVPYVTARFLLLLSAAVAPAGRLRFILTQKVQLTELRLTSDLTMCTHSTYIIYKLYILCTYSVYICTSGHRDLPRAVTRGHSIYPYSN